MTHKIILGLGILAFSGAPAFSADLSAKNEIKVDVMDDYHARPELEGIVSAEELDAARPGDLRRGDRRGRRDRRDDGWNRRDRDNFGFMSCFARNRRGVTFRATGFGSARMIQREAMESCQARSFGFRSCRPLGCR